MFGTNTFQSDLYNNHHHYQQQQQQQDSMMVDTENQLSTSMNYMVIDGQKRVGSYPASTTTSTTSTAFSTTFNAKQFQTTGTTNNTTTTMNNNRRALGDISNIKSNTMQTTTATTQKQPLLSIRTTTATTTTTTTNNNYSSVLPNSGTTTTTATVQKTQTSYTSPVRKNNSEAMMMSPKIDAADSNNSLACTEYVKDIFAHYKSIESKYLPDPTYLSRHPNFNEQTRLLTINWLMTIHGYYEFAPETIYLCVNIFDRFLSRHPDMSLDKIHLVAITSLFIASKYEEIKPLNTEHLIKITRKAYTKEDILIMERLILKTLDFNLTIASVYVFLKRYLKCSGNYDNVQVQIATFVAEMSLYDTAMLNYTPSTVACASIYVARALRKCGGEKWNSNLVYYSGKTEDDILSCAKQVYYFMKCFCHTPTFDSGRKSTDKNFLLAKFSKPEHLKISESIKQVFEQKKRSRDQ